MPTYEARFPMNLFPPWPSSSKFNLLQHYTITRVVRKAKDTHPPVPKEPIAISSTPRHPKKKKRKEKIKTKHNGNSPLMYVRKKGEHIYPEAAAKKRNLNILAPLAPCPFNHGPMEPDFNFVSCAGEKKKMGWRC